jgi:hypothetical protein
MVDYACRQLDADRPLDAVARALGVEPQNVLHLVDGTGAAWCSECGATSWLIVGDPLVCAACDRVRRGVDLPLEDAHA